MTSLNFDIAWRDHGASRGLVGLSKDSDRATAAMSKLKTGATIAAVAGGAALLKFGKDSVKAYTEAQASQAKLQFAFTKFPKLADTNLQALQGLNSELAKKTRYDDDATASGQAVLAQFKLTGQQITQLTPLLQDYAAKTGKDLPTAARDLGKAVLGQGRALKAVGLDLKDAGSAGANFDQVMVGLRTNVGGFAEREGKTAAGQTEILKNQFGELQETAGEKLLPAVSGVVGGLTDLVEVVGDNAHVIGPLVGVTAGLAATIWTAHKATQAWGTAQSLNNAFATKAVTGLNLLKTGWTGVELSSKAAGRAMRVAQLSIPLAGIALFGVTTAMAAFADKTDVGTAEAADFATAMQGMEGDVNRVTTALDKNVRAQAVNSLQQSGAYDLATKLGISLGTVTDSAVGNAEATAYMNKTLSDYIALGVRGSEADFERQKNAGQLANILNDLYKQQLKDIDAEKQRRDAMGRGNTLGQRAAEIEAELGDARTELRDKTRNLNTEMQKMINKFSVLKTGAVDQEQANIAWQESLDGIAASAKENGKSLDRNTRAGRDNRRAVLSAAQAMNDKATADFQADVKAHGLKKATELATDRLESNRRTLRKAAADAGFNKDEIDKMIRKMVKTPKELRTDINTPGVKTAQEQVDKLRERIEKLKKKYAVQITYDTNAKKLADAYRVSLNKGERDASTSGNGNNPKKKANGGPITGVGGPREDNITGIDRRTGRQTADVSVGEFVTNEQQYRRNRRAVETINAGGEWDVVPRGVRQRLAGGGPVARTNIAVGASGSTAMPDFDAISSKVAKGIANKLGPAIGDKMETARRKYEAKQEASLSSTPSKKMSGSITQIARRFNPSYIAGHRDPQGGPAFDIGASGAKNNAIANALRVNHARLGLRYVISQMRITSPRSPSWQWRRYTPITGSGDFRHVNHVHVSYDQGGLMMPGQAGVNRSRLPERVLTGKQTQSFDRLVRVITHTGGASTVRENHFHFPNYVGSTDDLRRALVDMDRRGQLAVIKRG